MNDLDGLIAYIVQHEAAGDWNAWNHGTRIRGDKPLTQMTVGEVMELQSQNLLLPEDEKFTAAGGIQIIHPTLAEEVSKGTVSPNEVFDEHTQRRLAVSLMRRRGLDDWMSGAMGTEDFGTNLAREWASLPVMKDTYRGGQFIARGQGYYGGVSTNPVNVASSVDEFAAVLADPGTYDPSLWPTASTSGAQPPEWSGRMGAPRPDYDAQFGNVQPSPGPDYPWQGAPAGIHQGNMDRLPGGRPQLEPGPGLPDADYRTRTGRGGGPWDVSWGRSFADSWQDAYFVRNWKETLSGGRIMSGSEYPFDPVFDPGEQMMTDGLGAHVSYLGGARNREHYNHLVRQIQFEEQRAQRRQAYDGWVAPFLGSMLNPDSLISLAIPGGVVASGMRRAGANAAGSALRAGAYTGAYESAVEAGRRQLDPLSSPGDSIARVAGATAFAALLGGVGGALVTPAARRRMAADMADEMARDRGIGMSTSRVDVGGREAEVGFGKVEAGVRVTYADGRLLIAEISQEAARRGGTVAGGRVVIDPVVIGRRMAAGDVPPGVRNANELAEYEIGFAASMARRARKFWSAEDGAVGPGPRDTDDVPFITREDVTGRPVVNRQRIEEALARGEPIRLGEGTRFPPIEVDASAFKSLEEAEEVIRRAHDYAVKARDVREFREAVDAAFGGRSQLEAAMDPAAAAQAARETAEAAARAEEDAARHLEEWRGKNNRILQSARVEAFARIMDGPYKRVHRNALSGKARDLMDRLAADGAFLRGSDGSGVNVGPSVYSRAKTWQGVTRRLWDRERELYAKYLGFKKNPEVADISINDFRSRRADGGEALPMAAWRDQVSKAYITGKKTGVPEMDEMVEHLRGAWAEYSDAADRFGVIHGPQTIAVERQRIMDRLDELEINARAGDLSKVDAAKQSRFEERLKELDERAKMAKGEPSEDYFTRVYSKAAIRDNLEAFVEKVVKPWMIQQPYVDVWELGARDLERELKAIKASGADINHPRYESLRVRLTAAEREGRMKSKWMRVEASAEPGALDKRARQMVATILEEADPDDLATLREAHRPVFGRHRQFDIPNAMLLKDGPNGNGIADFIETDYLLVHRIYADRMGPAIEMARSFARPVDGIDATAGWEEALARVKGEEYDAWARLQRDPDLLDLPPEAADMTGFRDHWAPIERDLLHMKDRVTNRVIRNPGRWDNRAAAVLRDWAALAFMGTSALPAIQDLGTLAMRHGVGRVWRNAVMEMDEGMTAAMKANVEEMRAAGAILDVAMGGALSRFAETGMDPVTGTAPERWLRTAANKYFLWNGLAPITTRMKELDAHIRVHDTLDRIDRVGLGHATKEDLAELDRWGIGRDDAVAIARNEPIFKADEGHWQANTAAWGSEDLVRKFRAAIAQGNENTVLMATAADKPTIIDGTIYLRKSGKVNLYAKIAGLREVGDYWQIQSGLMTLPFQFWNYSIAATNKILIAGLDEPSAQKLGGIAAMIGLGWMVAQVRTDPFVWSGMTVEDKIAKAVDQSGVTGVLGNMTNLWQGSMIAATGVNPLPYRPVRSSPDPSMGDQAFAFAGAGPSVLRNFVGGTLGGDLSDLGWAMPLRNHIGLSWLFDAATDGVERRYSGMDAG